VPLIDRSDSVLVVIDAQPGFSGDGERDAESAIRSRAVAAWLAGVATALDIPGVVTEEDAETNGPTDPAIQAAVGDRAPVLAKGIFGLTDEPEIIATLDATGRRTAVLVGAETDVCIAHSAIGLLELGWRVVVVPDATFSPGAMHELGLSQLRDAGVTLRHAKGVYYDWVRTVEAARAFQAEHPDLAEPPGFSL
jgi:nicotinamidase-related amidase